jgi:hypothetical protein
VRGAGHSCARLFEAFIGRHSGVEGQRQKPVPPPPVAKIDKARPARLAVSAGKRPSRQRDPPAAARMQCAVSDDQTGWQPQVEKGLEAVLFVEAKVKRREGRAWPARAHGGCPWACFGRRGVLLKEGKLLPSKAPPFAAPAMPGGCSRFGMARHRTSIG